MKERRVEGHKRDQILHRKRERDRVDGAIRQCVSGSNDAEMPRRWEDEASRGTVHFPNDFVTPKGLRDGEAPVILADFHRPALCAGT